MTDKKDFADSIRQKLEDWDYQLDRLTARLGDKRDEWRAEAKQRIADIEERRDAMEAKLEKLESHGEDAWQDIKAGVELAWDGLKTGLLAARSEFEDGK